MPFKKGQVANPNGARRPQKFLQALERAIAQDGGVKFRKAAEMLLESASQGEPWALHMLADRIDGKADQTLSIIQIAQDMSDDDLLRVAAGSSPRITKAKASKEISTEVH